MTEEVLVSVDGAVATVTLNRPARLNAMTHAMQIAYCRALVELDADPGVRCIVTTGAGRGFCAGADLADGDFAASVRQHLADTVDEPLDAPLHLHTPHVCAINGPSAGMGTAYALMAHVRFAGESARIGTTFSRLGLPAEWASAHTLSRIVGHAAATELLISGRYVGPAEALSSGLVTRVWPDDRLLGETYAWARDVAANTSPASQARILAQLRAVGDGQSVDDAFTDAVGALRQHLDLADLPAAVAAYRAKAAASFPPYPAP